MVASTVFTNNRTQAVRLPAELRLPSGIKLVDIRARGNERIIVPLNQSWTSFFEDATHVTEDFMTDRASQEQAPREEI